MVPRTMRAVLLKGHGGLEQLEYRSDVAVPEPRSGEVLLRIAAAGLNNTDLNLRTGWYAKIATGTPGADAGWTGNAVTFPRIQGADACGTIVAVGAGVDSSRVGERVIVNPVLRAPDTPLAEARYFGSDCNGAFADYATAPAGNALRISSSLSDAELAAVPCSYAAAENLLTRAGVAAGERVLVTGASGGVGCAAVQLAHHRGARVTALTQPSKTEFIRALGAAAVLARDADLHQALGPESMDVIIDVVGGSQFGTLLEILRHGGRYAVAGAIGGARVSLDLRTLYLKDLRLLGCTLFEPERFAQLVGYLERAELKPVVSATYALRDLAAAQTAFATKTHVGKIVLIP